MAIYVDPGRPDVWRSEPFISQIKKWAILFLKTDAHIAVYVGKRVFVILPDREVDLGIVNDEQFGIKKMKTPAGFVFDAWKA